MKSAIKAEMGKRLSIDMFGARPGSEYVNGSMSSGTNRLTVAGGNFAASDVGSKVCVPGALGLLVDPLVATITAVVSATQVDLSDAATNTVASVSGAYGPECYDHIVEALANCRKRGYGSLFIPSGLWFNSGGYLPVLSNIDIFGRGRSSIIYSANYANSAFYAQTQERVSLRGLSFRSHGVVRSSLSTTAAIWLRECQNVDVADVYINGSSSAGVFADLCDSVHVKSVEVKNTKADGVHVVGCIEAIIDGIRGYRTGDDTVSVVSYLSQRQSLKVNISNVISVESRTRAVTVGGSANVLVTHCQGIAPGAHGIIIVYESGGANPAAELHTPYNVTVSQCRLENALGSLGPPEGFHSLLIAGDATHIVDDVLVQGCTIVGSNQAKIAFSKNVRVLGNEVRNSRFSGLLVEDCEDVDTINNKLKTIEGIGISYVRVTDGQISGNRLTECQTLDEFGTNASEGRIHIVDSTDVYGFGNRDKRSAAVASFGAILVSGGARVSVGVTEIDVDAVDVDKRVKGMEVASLRDAGAYKDQLLLGTRIPVNVDRYAIVSDRGLYVEEGDIHIDGVGSFLGSGGAAYANLSSGFAQIAATSSVRVWINRTDVDPNNTFFVTTGSGSVIILSLTTGGDLFTKGGLHPGNTSSGVGFYCFDGNPNGNVAAPVGSFCARNWSTLTVSGSDAPLYHKESGGSGNTGWVTVNLAGEIPSVSGNAKKALRVNDGGTGYGWSVVPLDDPGAISVGSIATARFLYHDGGNQIVGKGPADIWSLIEAIVNANAQLASTSQVTGLDAALADLQTQLDGKASSGHGHSGTTGTGGTPAHDHSISL